MSMPRVEYAPRALDDLRRIREYISVNWGEEAATRILRKITSDIRRLEEYPVSGVDLGKMIDVPTEYRYLFSQKNYIFYRLDLDKIRIIRVLNEVQDYMEQLFEISSETE